MSQPSKLASMAARVRARTIMSLPPAFGDKLRSGHRPGIRDVSTMTAGEPFEAYPNFFYFVACARPCWLPIYPEPRIMPGQSVTQDWPFEPHRASPPESVARLRVIGQVRGEEIRNEHRLPSGQLESSDIWNVVRVPASRVRLEMVIRYTPDRRNGYIGFAPDIWLGNTGWHSIAE